MKNNHDSEEKSRIWQGVYLGITLIAVVLSIFKFDNPIALAAWIAPIFFMRFTRTSRWLPAVIAGFLGLQLTVVIGFFLPFIPMMEEASNIVMDSTALFNLLLRRGAITAAPLFMLPFLLDKALYKRLPAWATSLVYPSSVITAELLIRSGGIDGLDFSATQVSSGALLMSVSLVGVHGLSFLIAWFAPLVNQLWKNDWHIKTLGKTGMVYILIFSFALGYGLLMRAFPHKSKAAVPVAGITMDISLDTLELDVEEIHFSELIGLPPAEFAGLMSSPQYQIDEVRRKTQEAISAGAKIIVWQEMAVRMPADAADVLLEEMRTLARENSVYLLISYFRIAGERMPGEPPMKNLGVLITSEGAIGWEYEKYALADGLEEYLVSPGSGEIPYLDTPYGRIGQVICADTENHSYLRQVAEKQIDLLLVPALDVAPYTPWFSLASAYRAVENGFTMVRITGLGYSAVIDPYYRLWAGQNSFIQGNEIFISNVPVFSRNTFYNSVGFFFPFTTPVLMLLLIAMTVFHGRRNI